VMSAGRSAGERAFDSAGAERADAGSSPTSTRCVAVPREALVTDENGDGSGGVISIVEGESRRTHKRLKQRLEEMVVEVIADGSSQSRRHRGDGGRIRSAAGVARVK